MSVLITGASGLLGRYIIKELLDLGKTPIGLDITPPNLSLNCFIAKGSILDKELLARICKENSVKEIIHLAALLQFGCEREPQHAIDVNVQGTLNVLEIARRTGVKNFVFASSGAVYGPTQDDIDEMTPTYPGVSLYGVTKLLAEKVGARYAEQYDISFTALRYWAVYGPGEVSSPGIAKVIKDIEKTILGDDIVISGVSASDKRHFTFVEDAARATVLAIENPAKQPQIFNIAGDLDSYSSFEEFHHIIKRNHKSAGSVTFTGKGQSRGKVNIAKARSILGYEPRYSLDKGIKENIKFLLS